MQKENSGQLMYYTQIVENGQQVGNVFTTYDIHETIKEMMQAEHSSTYKIESRTDSHIWISFWSGSNVKSDRELHFILPNEKAENNAI